MSIVVVVVGLLAAVPIGNEHHEIGDQIGQRVDAIRDQGLRVREHADDHLQSGQHQVDDHADPRAAFSHSVALWRILFGVVLR